MIFKCATIYGVQIMYTNMLVGYIISPNSQIIGDVVRSYS